MCSAEVAAGALLPLALPYKQLVVVMVLLFPLNALDLLRAIECAQDIKQSAQAQSGPPDDTPLFRARAEE